MDIDWTRQLVEQLTFQWEGHLRPRLDDLSDEAYRWEPVDGCWSIRRREDATTSHADGAGDTVIDFAYPEPDVAPFTTIAWRLGHISIGVFGARAANHFADGGVDYDTTDWPLDAAGGVELLDRHYAAWIEGVRAMTLDDLGSPCGPHEGPFADHPYAELVLHINREALHHAAEVATVLDLYRHRASLHG